MTELIKLLSNYASLCQDKPTPQRIAVTAEVLNGTPIESVATGLKLHFRNSKWFPSPSEILKYHEQTAQDAAQLAWASLVSSARTRGFYQGPPELTASETRALDSIGGWEAICLCEVDQLPVLAAQFRRAMECFVSHEQRQHLLDAGHRHELGEK